jgi:hypothetical protein
MRESKDSQEKPVFGYVESYQQAGTIDLFGISVMTVGSERQKKSLATVCLMALLCFAAPAHADTLTTTPSRGLQEALGSTDQTNLFGNNGKGFSLSGNVFSGLASGNDPAASGYMNGAAGSNPYVNQPALLGDQSVYALLVDGAYDFDYDLGTGLPLHPYLGGGVGMAMYGTPPGGGLAMQDGDMVPLFRVGGGVTYRLGEQWDLSLDYKAGFTGGNDQIFTVRTQQPVDMQVLNMGMHYTF